MDFCAFILGARNVRRTDNYFEMLHFLIIYAVPGKRHRMALFWP